MFVSNLRKLIAKKYHAVIRRIFTIKAEDPEKDLNQNNSNDTNNVRVKSGRNCEKIGSSKEKSGLLYSYSWSLFIREVFGKYEVGYDHLSVCQV